MKIILLAFKFPLYPIDISMQDWMYAAPSGLPHTSFIKRIPQSKDIEFKIVGLSTALP
jgi:hypothetical protein